MNVLIIGDSHAAGAFGKALRDELAAQGHTVKLAGVGSTAIKTWLNKDKVCQVNGKGCIEQSTLPKDPDLLVLVLGTNDAANAVRAGGNLAKQADANVQKLLKVAQQRYQPQSFLWIGPPWMGDNVPYYTNAGVAELYDAADRAGVAIYDSRTVTRPLVENGSGDGVHLGAKGAKQWAQSVAASLTAAPTPTTPTTVGNDPADDADQQYLVTEAGFSPLLLLGAVVGGVLLARALRQK